LCLVAVDLFRVLDVKARAQTAADAAALAAARELAIPSPESTQEAAAQYATLNGATLQSCVCQRGSLEAVVAVEVPVRLVFLSSTRPVVGRARAVVEGGGG
jgi:Flp pilus assembly protein TadG